MSKVKEALHEKRRYMLAHYHWPARLPFVGTIVYWLLLDRLDAPGWVYGVVFTIVGIIWAAAIHDRLAHDWVQRSPVWRDE